MNPQDAENPQVSRYLRQLYDREASAYVGKTASYDNFPGLVAEIDRFSEAVLPSRPVVDIGCGIGRDSQFLLRRGHVVTAFDLSWEMLAITRRRCGDHPLLRAVQGDMNHMPFRELTFGGAWICASLVHVPTAWLGRVLDDVFRVLRPGAAISISMRSGAGEGWHTGISIAEARWFTFVQPESFRSLLLSHGFADVAVASSGRCDWFVATGRRS